MKTKHLGTMVLSTQYSVKKKQKTKKKKKNNNNI